MVKVSGMAIPGPFKSASSKIARGEANRLVWKRTIKVGARRNITVMKIMGEPSQKPGNSHLLARFIDPMLCHNYFFLQVISFQESSYLHPLTDPPLSWPAMQE